MGVKTLKSRFLQIIKRLLLHLRQQYIYMCMCIANCTARNRAFHSLRRAAGRQMASRTLKRADTGERDRDISPPPSKRTLTATTTNRAVANFFKPVSEKEPEKIKFQILQESLLVGRYEGATSVSRPKPVKIAAFDFDDTLIKTKSGNVFARGAEDWQWWHANVPGRLKQLDEEGFAVIVVSNQGLISFKSQKGSEKKALSNFKEKVSAVFRTLELPITMYAATEKDLFRKPRTQMWEQMLKDYGLEGSEDIDRDKCVLVGDAAGRVGDKAAKKRNDHSCSDRDFAANVGIPFYTPEEYFLDEPKQPFVRAFDPKPYTEVNSDSHTDIDPILFTKKHDMELVLFCGSPGAGKSTFYWHHMQPLGYERVNQDTLKTRDKCIKVAMQLLSEERKSVVVDNTNADLETRAAWIGVAGKLQVPIRLVHFTAPAKLCEHNDTVRALSAGLMNPEKRSILPRMAFTSFASRYREPKVEEGFGDITKVDFVLHGSEEERALWGKYWIS